MAKEDQPYESELEYLEDELGWIETRCKRIITKRLVEHMHGRIDVVSQAGEGSVFTLTFPVLQDTAPASRPSRPAAVARRTQRSSDPSPAS